MSEENTNVEVAEVFETAKTYVGPREVIKETPIEQKTYEGGDVLVLTFDGGLTQMITKKTYDLVKTNEPKDFNYVRDQKVNPALDEIYHIVGDFFHSIANGADEETRKASRKEALSKILSVTCEYDITAKEVESVVNQVMSHVQSFMSAYAFELDSSFERANNFLWTGNDKHFVPGYSTGDDRTYMEAKVVLGKIPFEVAPENKDVASEEPKAE